MSKLIYCADEACFRKQITDEPDDVIKLSWSKVKDSTGKIKYYCPNHTWEIHL